MPRKIKNKNQQHACGLFLSENAQEDFFFLTKGLGKIMMQLISWTWHTWHISLVVCPHIQKCFTKNISTATQKGVPLRMCSDRYPFIFNSHNDINWIVSYG